MVKEKKQKTEFELALDAMENAEVLLSKGGAKKLKGLRRRLELLDRQDQKKENAKKSANEVFNGSLKSIKVQRDSVLWDIYAVFNPPPQQELPLEESNGQK